ncbi:hypothetical protein SLEP1_g27765 [Rubroshorea leprosula]|uniref:Uncharacterized protein n=1 Tax=Rubroshorea leprosula TaxID=152421 RepID=A0AAV5JU59_9ROSI|nr:hypothetical protein SLEP1_g27765 [Rubroshorea leprosula]
MRSLVLSGYLLQLECNIEGWMKEASAWRKVRRKDF